MKVRSNGKYGNVHWFMRRDTNDFIHGINKKKCEMTKERNAKMQKIVSFTTKERS